MVVNRGAPVRAIDRRTRDKLPTPRPLSCGYLYDSLMTHTGTPVAVVEPAAAFRRGLEAALRTSGFEAQTPSDPLTWAKEQPHGIVVATLRSKEDCELIEAIAEAGTPVVALLPASDTDEYSHALRHGAVAAADWNAEPDAIAEVVAAAAAGLSLLPTTIVRKFADRGNHGHSPMVGSEEVSWLQALANGVSVVDLADEFGYSERSLFRRLHDLYGRLGVNNRAAAIIEAERLGLLSN